VELLQWFVSPGDSIAQFDRVCEVQSDKATVEITSRYDGTVLTLNGAVGDMMIVGEALLELDVEGAGDSVTVKSEEPGVMKEPLTIPSASNTASNSTSNSTSHGPRSTGGGNDKILTTPAVRKIAKENNVDLATVTGTGSKGRILKEDVLMFLGQAGAAGVNAANNTVTMTSGGFTNASSPASSAPLAHPTPPTPLVGDRREPIRGYARMMVSSMNASLTIPHFGYGDEILLNSLASLRSTLKPYASQHNVSLSYMPFFIKAASLSLLQYPVLNSSIAEKEDEIIYHGSHNIGIAMDTPKGLIVPNIKNCQNLSVMEIAMELNRLQADAGGNGIASADLMGTTFSLSNIGAIGGTYMVPVINTPQVAIGALGKIQTLPRYNGDGDVEKAMVMCVSWAGDHRIVDGATMSRFSNMWKDYLENPGKMVVNMR
jgi:2-oxoisovalerate dehydrogenase E2 component (dihydrolipoyl transacylase)